LKVRKDNSRLWAALAWMSVTAAALPEPPTPDKKDDRLDEAAKLQEEAKKLRKRLDLMDRSG
jgi:hypothetical protein